MTTTLVICCNQVSQSSKSINHQSLSTIKVSQSSKSGNHQSQSITKVSQSSKSLNHQSQSIIKISQPSKSVNHQSQSIIQVSHQSSSSPELDLACMYHPMTLWQRVTNHSTALQDVKKHDDPELVVLATDECLFADEAFRSAHLSCAWTDAHCAAAGNFLSFVIQE